MTTPFREAELSALARAEELEAVNEELRQEIERLRDRVGENRDAYVTNIENQLKALKGELSVREAQSVWWPKPQRREIDPQVAFVMGVVGVLSFVSAVVMLLVAR